MSIELKEAAQQAVDAFDAFGDADDFASLFELTQKMRALHTALQQAEAQQPATPEPVVQADSSEHLRVIASLGAALRRLSFAAQTTGGTDGPDAELQSAIGQAEQALSLGGIWQAMSATAEPVKAAPYNPTEEMRWAMKRIDPTLSSEQCRALWSAAWSAAPSTHPAPSVPTAWTKDPFLVVHAMEMNNWNWKSEASNDLKRDAHAAATRLYAATLAAKEGGAA